MDAQTVTIISGIVLLMLFALVGVYVRRRSAGRKSMKSSQHEPSRRRSIEQKKRKGQHGRG